ncbi:MAG TPA: PepSY domain-containing protein [Halomonas sp.]|nr:PepSY domain-containing protein [Halomonas sp.]
MKRTADSRSVKQKAALRGFFCWALLSLSLGWAPVSYAGRDIDQDEALYLVEQGVVKPLQEFIDDAQERFPGRFLEAELEWDDGRYVYELEIVTRTNRVLELEYDAVTGRLLDVDEDD